LIGAGRSDDQSARELVLTRGTVAHHVEHILRRLEVSNRAQVAAWVVERGVTRADAATPAPERERGGASSVLITRIPAGRSFTTRRPAVLESGASRR